MISILPSQEHSSEHSYKNSPERPLTVITSLEQLGTFPFNGIDLSPFSKELERLGMKSTLSLKNKYWTDVSSVYESNYAIFVLQMKINVMQYPLIKSVYRTFWEKDKKEIPNIPYVPIVVYDDHLNSAVSTPLGIFFRFRGSEDEDIIVLHNHYYQETVLIKNGKYICLKYKKDKKDKKTKKCLEFICDDKTCQGVLTTESISDQFVFRLENNILHHCSEFKNNKTSSHVTTYMCKKNNEQIQFTNKNGLYLVTHYNYATDLEKKISTCMINEHGTGLRFRGTYESSSLGGKNIEKILKKDDEIVYKKDGDHVVLNKLEDDEKKERDVIIGWKLAETSWGEKRIVKLAILPDARVVRPIDEEYFKTRGKERCEKAIVIDIQYPEEEKEISVPHEKVAYSFLYDQETPLEYKLGSEVVPDRFDPDENTSCTHGIHFYSKRKSVFDVYINR